MRSSSVWLQFSTECYTTHMLTLQRSPVQSNPRILGGTLVFQGTRVPAQTLLDYLDDGYSLEQFLEFFPSVDRHDAEMFLQLARGNR
jgi:uncharacterized protein (DUF433 family)